MTTYNTGNPIGSKDPRDLYDNAENLDEAVNTRTAASWNDRFGAARKAWWGMEQEFNTDQESRDNRFNTFIASSGYQFLGDYAAGIEITEYNQIVRDADGEFWRLSGQVELPYTTTGAGLPEGDALTPLGDAVLRQQLADPSDPENGANMIAQSVVRVASVPALLALPTGQRPLGQVYMTDGYHAAGIGSSMYTWDAAYPKNKHNGGTVIDPDRPFPSAWGRNPETEAWFTSSASGTGCFVRSVGGPVSPETFGARADGGDDTLPFQAACDSVAELVLTDGLEYTVSETAPSPDGHAGNYCILLTKPITIRGNERRASLIVPANSHGIISASDDVVLNGFRIAGSGMVGTIGHHIKINGPVKRQRVYGMRFTGVSDAAVNTSCSLNDVLENWNVPGFDPFSVGPSDVWVYNNEIEDCRGDAAIELQGLTDAKIFGNVMRNEFGHGIRVVGVRKADVFNNHGDGVGRGGGEAYSALVTTFSGGITRTPGDLMPIYNEDINVIGNTGVNCQDGLHFGIGSINVAAHNNVIEARTHSILIQHTGGISRWGIKNHTISGNTFSGGRVAILMRMTSASPPPDGAPLVSNSQITGNTFNGLLEDGIRTPNQAVNSWVEDSDILRNTFNFADPESETARAIYIVRSRRVNYDRNETNLLSSRDLVLSIQEDCQLPNMTEYRVFVDGNRFVSVSPRNWQTGKAVRVRSTGTLPTPLDSTSLYYLIADSDRAVRMATSLDNAISGVGFSLTSEGTGRHYIAPL